MTELLNTGKRIKHFRVSCGMTQKALGIAVGFPQETADVRIAQYESGARTPKQNLLCQMARGLGVPLSALAELYYLLLALEEEHGIVFSPKSDNAKAFYESHGERSKKR